MSLNSACALRQKPFFKFNREVHARFAPEKHRQEQKFLREQVRGGQLQQPFFLLDADDGKERPVTSVTYSGSENGYSTPTPGPVDFDDRFDVLYKSLYTQYE